VNRFQLENGVTVLALNRPGAALVRARFVCRSAGADGPVAEAAARSSVASTLVAGRPIEALDAAGAVSPDAAEISFAFAPSEVTAALELLGASVRGQLDEGRWSALRMRHIAALASVHRSPGRLSRQDVLHRHFGDQRALSLLAAEEARLLTSVSVQQLNRSWRGFLVPQNSALVLVGDLDLSTAEVAVRRALADWPPAPPVRATSPSSTAPQSSAVRVIHTPIAAPHFAMAFPAPGRLSEDFAAFSIAEQIFSSMHSSRLFGAVREEHGLSYLLDSTYSSHRRDGTLLIEGALEADKIVPALGLLFEQVRLMSRSAPQQEEMAAAKAQLRARLRERFERDAALAELLAESFVYDLPLASWTELDARIAAASAEDVRRVAARYLKPEQAPIALAGDAVEIGAQLQWSGWRVEYAQP
jgi:predicted Zn-dependent peptidase